MDESGSTIDVLPKALRVCNSANYILASQNVPQLPQHSSLPFSSPPTLKVLCTTIHLHFPHLKFASQKEINFVLFFLYVSSLKVNYHF